jgi:signal peptidase I
VPISERVFGAEPERGDIAVFKLPRDNSTDYIKRVIGLPNDRIQMINGILHINDVAVKKAPVGKDQVGVGAGLTDEATYFQETLPNGVTYTIQELEKFGNKLGRNTDVYVVPPGHFFMMGDNRDNSLDSRDMSSQGVGYVPYENFVGRAEIIFFSINSDGAAWKIWEWPTSVRWSRIFSSIH